MGRWKLASACEIGTSHISNRKPCQDSAAHALFRSHEGNVLVAAVADGAGSAAHSEIGSEYSCRIFVHLVREHFESGAGVRKITREQICEWINAIAEDLRIKAERSGHEARDYSCTLLTAIITPSAAVFSQVGDGAIVVSEGEEDGWVWVFWPLHGEFANQTVFILSENATKTLQYDFMERRVQEFSMFSDGIERLVLNVAEKTVNGSFFEHMFKPLRSSKGYVLDEKISEQLKSYLASDAINARTNDDKTLFMATCKERAIG